MPLRIVQVEKAEMEKVGGNCLSFRSIHAKTEHKYIHIVNVVGIYSG